MKQFSEEEVRAAEAELDRVRDDWLRRPGVTAVDVGYRLSGERMLDELAVRVHVERKLPLDALSPEDIFPVRLGEFPVDILEVEYAPQDATAEDAETPERPGASGVEPLE